MSGIKNLVRHCAIQAVDRVSPRLLAARRLKQQLRGGEPELAFIPLLADPEGDFLDVGANVGIWSFHALAHFRRVVAVEPHPDLAGPLRRMLGRDGELLPVALSDHEGSAILWVPRLARRAVLTRSSLNADANAGLAQHELHVRVTSIDLLGLDRPAVVKIDVEGHELTVLAGARETLARVRPACIVEVEERHNQGGIARAFAFFDALGYQGFFLHRGRLHPASEFDAARLQSAQQSKAVGGGRSADYVNNFLFVHRDRQDSLAKLRAAF